MDKIPYNFPINDTTTFTPLNNEADEIEIKGKDINGVVSTIDIAREELIESLSSRINLETQRIVGWRNSVTQSEALVTAMTTARDNLIIK